MQNGQPQQLKKVHARELESHIKSKRQLYNCLSLEGKC